MRSHARSSQGGVLLMTPFTGLGGRSAQVMAMMAVGAPLVSPDKCSRRVDLWRTLHAIPLMTRRAGLTGARGGAVGSMTVETLIDLRTRRR
jgi:hypothetical protein